MAHNGGRSSVNVGDQTSVEYPFIDHLKTGDGWRWSLTTALPSIVDIDGFPQSNPAQPLLTVVTSDPIAEGDAIWVLKWVGGDGSSSLKLDPGSPGVTVLEGASFVSGPTSSSMTTTGGNGRIKFTYNSHGIGNFNIVSVGAIPFSKIGLMRAVHEARYDAGEVWNPDFVARLKLMNPGLIRFLAYSGVAHTGVNGSTANKWAYRPRTTAFSFGQDLYPPGAWGGTVSGTDTYTASAAADTPGSWTSGEVFIGKFTNANTLPSPTINIAGRGAKELKFIDGSALAAGDITASTLFIGIYDADLNAMLIRGNIGAFGGVPIEYQVDLCNQIGAHGWFIVPHLADDDYITQLATLIKSRLNSGLRAYIEYSNEIWNFLFYQTGWANNKGIAAGIPAGSNRRLHYWYAKRFAQMADLVRTVFGTQTTDYPVIGVQAVGFGPDYDTYRLQGADVPLSSPNRPIDKARVRLAPATYFYGSRCKQFDADYAADANMTTLEGWADDYATGTQTQKNAAIASVDSDVRNGGPGTDLNTFQISFWKTWNDLAVTYGAKIAEYEAALAIKEPSVARLTALGIDTAYSAKIENLFAAYKNDERSENVTLDHYNTFVAQSNAEFPNNFTIAGNQWSVMSDLYATPYKIEEAIEEFNAVSPGLQETSGAKGKRKKKIRGPYSDPRVYDEYIKKAIAEHEGKPEQNVALAVVQEALVAQIEERQQTGYEEPAALSMENQLLSRLAELESKNKRLVSKVHARQRQIDAQLEDMKQEEEVTRNILILLHEL